MIFDSKLEGRGTYSEKTKKGSPTLYAITEADTFSVNAIQRYDRYPVQLY